MSEATKKARTRHANSRPRQSLWTENPYDIETFFETLSLASSQCKEMLFMDRFINELRNNSDIDLTALNHALCEELDMMSLEATE